MDKFKALLSNKHCKDTSCVPQDNVSQDSSDVFPCLHLLHDPSVPSRTHQQTGDPPGPLPAPDLVSLLVLNQRDDPQAVDVGVHLRQVLHRVLVQELDPQTVRHQNREVDLAVFLVMLHPAQHAVQYILLGVDLKRVHGQKGDNCVHRKL